MEVLRPAFRAHQEPGRERFSGEFYGGAAAVAAAVASRLPEIVEEGGGEEKVYVAVGKCSVKDLSLLQWTFKRFGGGGGGGGREICLLHVHQPSPFIPTLLGKLPASKANAVVVSAFRTEERERMKKLLADYLNICSRAKVKASIITTEADLVHKAIVELMNKHAIRKLVMGAVPDNCMKVKKGCSKANYAAKKAPPFCEIWFVNKGKHVWTREASESLSTTAETLRSRSFRHCNSTLSLTQDRFLSQSTNVTCAGINDWGQSKRVHVELPMLPTLSSSLSGCRPHYDQSLFSPRSTSTGSGYASAERRESTDSGMKVDDESLCDRLREARAEAEALRNKASAELVKRKSLETEALEAISKVKFFESAHAHEVKFRKEAEDALRTTIEEQDKLLDKKEEVTRELQKTMRHVALLDRLAQEANRRCDQATGELRLIEASISTLRQEKQRIRRQKIEAARWLERWRSRGQAGAANCNGFNEFVEDLPESAEFSLADLQTATCGFSESFKIGQGGFGCVYKGEMLGRTVAIKKLHPHNMQGQSEFQQEVRVLSKLQHPHLVTLLGACPEAWSLVYEHLPNGSLQDRLFRKSNISPLTWKVRVRIAAEISSALCFLHSSKPDKIVHGDLKPENILLDSELSCKICDFGICRLVAEETLYLSSFQRGTVPKGAFPYSDPELHRTGVLTPKSDIYSFGLIILQLLTGKPPVGLAGEVRKAVSCGNLTSVLDSSAGEWPTFVARRLLDLGLQCCELYCRDRPDLTPALVRELEQLHVAEERPVPSFFLCPILQEIMHDPQVAADGFTYEGEALHSWLENGRNTSPMTNLEFSHLHLTPNHALRVAIQDWLCRT
ncbi:hypothetical protein Ddye_024859 [Dipteronia dyeriana]|uniref:RING-type E3 ubiquitin transferase n=1 Tax=Dipteronia dyeriana TaxID=168575 RepID=A0AAD9WU04_9ROSI|nr:hypothetical protein Ddye_024859 [Dipteronia dyeriana]